MVLSRENQEMFQNSFFLGQLSVNASFSGVALAEPYQNSKCFVHQTNTLYKRNSFPGKKLQVFLEKMLEMEPSYDKVTS